MSDSKGGNRNASHERLTLSLSENAALEGLESFANVLEQVAPAIRSAHTRFKTTTSADPITPTQLYIYAAGLRMQAAVLTGRLTEAFFGTEDVLGEHSPTLALGAITAAEKLEALAERATRGQEES